MPIAWSAIWNQLDWSEGIKKLQRDWIGRSTGAEVDFFIGPGGESGVDSWKAERARAVSPQTRRRGAADLHHASRHAVRRHLHGDRAGASVRRAADDAAQKQAVERLLQKAAGKSDLERTELAKEKTGVFTGSYAINPVNGEEVPIWIADYVLISYGTGAIMAVPAHDERDYEFAGSSSCRSSLSSIRAMRPKLIAQVLAGEECFAGLGHCHQLRRLRRPLDQRIQAADHRGPGRARLGRGRPSITSCATGCSAGSGSGASRFRSCTNWTPRGSRPAAARRADPEDLPVDLPKLDDFKPHGRPSRRWRRRPRWLYPRSTVALQARDQHHAAVGRLVLVLPAVHRSQERQGLRRSREGKAWMPVDLYVGGAEHAVLHLLYARFWHKVLYDRGHVSTPEPFQRLVNQGMILGETEYTGFRTKAAFSSVQKTSPRGRRHRPIHQGRLASRSVIASLPTQLKSKETPLCSRPIRRFGLTAGPTRCPRAAATSSIPTPSCATTAPTRCGCTRCSWDRWRRPSRGAWRG
jgi:leucyl-tRNA synthetase